MDRSIWKWTTHKLARGFKAPARNLQLPPIKSPFDQERDRSFTILQNMMGPQAAMTLELWVCIAKLRDQQAQMIKAAKQALSPAREDPERVETLDLAISTFLEGARASRKIVDKDLAQGIKDSLWLSAAMFNKVTLSRRKMTIRGLADIKGARERLEECQPSD